MNSKLHGLYSGLGSSDENGRLTPNANRDFDLWFLNYDSRGNLIDGPLGTDRTHQLKVRWTYVTPWDMEVGGFFRAMSGTPISRTVDLEHADVMVDNRGSDGRNPAWTQTDLSLVQRFHPFSDETRSLEVNLNVINLFNQGTPLRTFRSLYRQSLPCGNRATLSHRSWTATTTRRSQPLRAPPGTRASCSMTGFWTRSRRALGSVSSFEGVYDASTGKFRHAGFIPVRRGDSS